VAKNISAQKKKMADDQTRKVYEDPELDDLLDEALEDFNKNDTITKSEDGVVAAGEQSDLWNAEFIQQQAKMFQEKMTELLGADEGADAALDFEKMAEAAGQVLQQQALDPEFATSINEVLKSLNEGQEAAQNPFSPDQLSGLFQSMDVNGAEGGESFVPFMQNMMQSLLSAEVLLPSLKDLVDKYPKWLEDNATKLSQEDKEKYTKQLGLMKEVVAELEKEKPTDSADAKKARFTVVLEKMSKMQDLGQPPADLVGEGGQALPNVDGDCNIM